MSQEISLEANREFTSVATVGNALVAILVCHVAVDALASLMPSSLGLIEARFSLTTKQSVWLLGLASLTSGLAQPVCAILSDRLATRQLGMLGVVLAVLGIAGLGFADSYVSLAATFAVGMIGIGMFHPVAASAVGQLRSDRRNTAVSIFFVAGMAGGALGALAWPRILSSETGFRILPWVVVPIIVLALLLQRTYAQLPPLRKHKDRHLDRPSGRTQWVMVAGLFVAASLRFCVHLSLIYLYVRWVQGKCGLDNPDWNGKRIAFASAPTIGNLNACTLAGMAVGGLSAGFLVRTGKEKIPMVLVPILFAPFVGLFPYAPVETGYGLALLSGIGFASMIPVSISLAQRALPHRPNLASSLMMGGAWVVSMLGPRCAEFGVERWGLSPTFHLTAATLAISGIVCLVIRNPRES